ncbi:MAG: hypothetical protein MAG581_00165 [Deltaproteobacteria bacterium]|nr:hypothetical protein [Deltaproteobacteria bacterium]
MQGGFMANYLVQASYTSGSWATQIQNPQNRLEQVNKMFAAKGVKFISGYYAFGEFDLCVIAEGPDNVTTASALIAAAAGGALSKIQTTVLMTAEEGLEAIKGAGSIDYTPPGA